MAVIKQIPAVALSIAVLLLATASLVSGWQTWHQHYHLRRILLGPRRHMTSLRLSAGEELYQVSNHDCVEMPTTSTYKITEELPVLSRRSWGSHISKVTASTIIPLMTVSTTSVTYPTTANALVKGVAPPTKSKASSGKPKCSNIDECNALREEQEKEEQAAAAAAENATPTMKTPGGTRYKDFQIGEGEKVVKEGEEVTIYYKVLKLGKRSYDGLSGEGTVVFSRGYGLEDDENKPGEKSFITTVGAYSNIAALNEVLVGMKVGGIRRLAVYPQKGWRKPGQECDGGPGGSGTGGTLRTDYVVVPTAQLVAEEACFDMTKQPFPTTYAQQRRMAQRFDQSLIMEVEVVGIK